MRIGIIGGGTMGLALAYRLGQAGHSATVFEAAPRVGGLATWYDYGDFTWDKFYHVFLKRDEHLLGLIDDLGLTHELKWNRTRTGFLWNGRQLSMSSNWEFLTNFPVLSFIDKVRLAAGVFYVQRIKDPEPLERIKVAPWMTRIFGTRVYESIWEPLLESKYGVLTDKMPATIMWATIRRYYSTRSKGGGKEYMGFLSSGFKTLYDGLLAAIAEQGGEVRCSAPVERIELGDAEGVAVRVEGERLEFDRVISTAPTSVIQRLAPGVAGLSEESEGRPEFLGVICLALVLHRPLNPYYVTNLIQKGFPFTGIIGVSNLTGVEPLNGRHLAMLPRYDVPDSAWFDRSSEEIATDFIAALRPIYPDIDENIVSRHVHREKLVQAIWAESPPTRHEPARSPCGRVWSVNAELAGRDTLNNNAIIDVANRAAAEFLKANPAASAANVESLHQPTDKTARAAVGE